MNEDVLQYRVEMNKMERGGGVGDDNRVGVYEERDCSGVIYLVYMRFEVRLSLTLLRF